MEPSEAKGSPQPSDVKRSPDYQGLERGFDDEKFKEEDRSLDLEDKPWAPPKFPSSTTADHDAKHDSMGEISFNKAKRHKNLQAASKKKIVKDERIKKEVARSDPQDRKVWSDPHDRKVKSDA